MATPFTDIKYSDVAQQGRGEKDTYARKYGYPGWNEMEAAGGASLGPKGGSIMGVSTSTPGFSQVPDFGSILQQAMQMQQQGIQPAVQSYQASIPETQQKYATETQRLQSQKEPLEKRYQNLLSQVTGQQQEETQRTGIATSRELGRRGISSESGLYEQTVNQALSPINRYYTGQIKDIGLSQEAGLQDIESAVRGIPSQETEAVRQIENAIAALQAGVAPTAVSQALNLTQLQQGAQQSAASQALQQQQMAQTQSYQQQQLELARQQEARQGQEAQRAAELALRQFQEYQLPYLQYQTSQVKSSEWY